MVKILKCEDVAILCFDAREGCFFSLNPVYTLQELMLIQSMQLQRFGTQAGITGMVFRTGKSFYSESLKGELNYNRESDNLTPVSFGFLGLSRLDW